MIELVTWASVLVLGPGSIAIFLWFVIDLRRQQKSPGSSTDEPPGERNCL